MKRKHRCWIIYENTTVNEREIGTTDLPWRSYHDSSASYLSSNTGSISFSLSFRGRFFPNKMSFHLCQIFLFYFLIYIWSQNSLFEANPRRAATRSHGEHFHLFDRELDKSGACELEVAELVEVASGTVVVLGAFPKETQIKGTANYR